MGMANSRHLQSCILLFQNPEKRRILSTGAHSSARFGEGGFVIKRKSPDTNSNCWSTIASVKSVPLVSMYKKPYFAAASIIDRPSSGVGFEISKMGSWRAATAVAPLGAILGLILIWIAYGMENRKGLMKSQRYPNRFLCKRKKREPCMNASLRLI
jgi:hypothetical protein